MTSWLEFGDPEEYHGYTIRESSESWLDGDFYHWFVIDDPEGNRVCLEPKDFAGGIERAPTSFLHLW